MPTPCLSSMRYGYRAESMQLWDDTGDYIQCGRSGCERRFVGGSEQSQLERYVEHLEDGSCGAPGP